MEGVGRLLPEVLHEAGFTFLSGKSVVVDVGVLLKLELSRKVKALMFLVCVCVRGFKLQTCAVGKQC